MSQTLNNTITVQVTVKSPISKVWKCYTLPQHITGWNFASDDWQCSKSKNDLRVGGTFSSRMEAKDGSVGFDFGGFYTTIIDHELIQYTMGTPENPDRNAEVKFERLSEYETLVTVSFEPENENPREMQQDGWQSILNNFKNYTESTSSYETIIKAHVGKVWNTITTSEEWEHYMNNMKIVSDWKVGESIVFTCYNPDGSVMLWNDREMIWRGVIAEKVTNSRFVVDYDGSAGIKKETYEIEKIDEQTTKVTFIQVANDPETASGYDEGNKETLKLLKDYLEK
jgi:uncharacterized protein YndB with AHSA1/START domain